jgi:hypothetical protein
MLWNVVSGHNRYSAKKLAAARLPSPWLTVIGLRTMWIAFREGLATHREYERLRSRGRPHDQALRESIGFAPRNSLQTPCPAKPLYCAGKA